MSSDGFNNSIIIHPDREGLTELRDHEERTGSADVCLVPEESEDESCQQLSASGAIDRIVRETAECWPRQSKNEESQAPTAPGHPAAAHVNMPFLIFKLQELFLYENSQMLSHGSYNRVFDFSM